MLNKKYELRVYRKQELSSPKYRNTHVRVQLSICGRTCAIMRAMDTHTVVVAYTSNANPPATCPTDTWGDVLIDSGEEDNDISQDEEELIRENMQNYLKDKRSGISTDSVRYLLEIEL